MIKALQNKELSDSEYIYTLKKIISNVQNGIKLSGLCEEMGNRRIIDEVNSHPVNTHDLKARDTTKHVCPMDLRLKDGKHHTSYSGCFYHCGYNEYLNSSTDEQIALVKDLIKKYEELNDDNDNNETPLASESSHQINDLNYPFFD